VESVLPPPRGSWPKVRVHYRTPSSGAERGRQGNRPDVTAIQGEVAKLADLNKLYDIVRRITGRVDIVFANAGIAEIAPLGEITEEHFERIFDINVKGLVFTVQKALPLMPDGGSIILNASIVASKGSPGWSVYSATKAALRSFARSWTADLKDRRIRVNAISPGVIETPGLNELLRPTKQNVETLYLSGRSKRSVGRILEE
jgi:NAD(P)-dependent dehydrogenase (short-subunit alcohol dehydrogenase family)